MIDGHDDLRTIADALMEAKSILIFPHILMDGDAMGSATALCLGLRSLGKEAWILLEDKIADYLTFMDRGCCTYDQDIIEKQDVSLCVDCGEVGRFPKRKEKFEHGKLKICIDHHRSSKPIFNLNHIDPGSAASGELVYILLKEMGIKINSDICTSIFAAITTDTGNYQYSNTTARSHEITVELINAGLDVNRVSVELYENEKPEKFRLHSHVMETLEIFAGGKGAIAFVTQDMIKKCGARMEDTEGIVADLRSLSGVQVAILLKEQPNGEIKATMRAKLEGDVATIAEKYEGGGHTKAAGCTLHTNMKMAIDIMKTEVSEQFEAGI